MLASRSIHYYDEFSRKEITTISEELKQGEPPYISRESKLTLHMASGLKSKQEN
jgi:hypothetical protein